MNYEAATTYSAPKKRGRPPPHWSQMLQSFSTGELLGSSEHWIIMARDKAAWNEFSTYFVQYVETHILREDTRTSLARDAISTSQE